MIEDQRRQAACASRLTASDAPELLGWRDGSRPGRGAREAVRDRPLDWHDGRDGSVVEAEMHGFFDPRAPDWLRKLLALRIADRALLGLIRQGRKAGSLEPEGRVRHPDPGGPPGGVVSPVVANVSWPEALALWCDKGVHPHGRGEALLSRGADDLGCAFRCRRDADWFAQARPQRLGNVTRAVAAEQTRRRRVSRLHPGMTRRGTGCGVAWSGKEDRQGGPRGTRRTARQKGPRACQRSKAWMQAHRHVPGTAFFDGLKARVRGPDRDDGVHGHAHALSRVFDGAMACAFTWRKRRGGNRRRGSWPRVTPLLAAVPLERPRMTESRRRRGSA